MSDTVDQIEQDILSLRTEFGYRARDNFEALNLSRRLINGIAQYVSRHPKSFKKLFGDAGTDRKILMDICMGYNLTIPLYLKFGYVTALKYALKQQGNISIQANSSDQNVFEFSCAENFDDVFSFDGKNKNPDDLSYIFNKAYKNTPPSIKLPGLVILPTGDKKALDKINKHEDLILNYMGRPRRGILDLRPNIINVPR